LNPAVESLRDTATPERAGERVAARLADVHELLGNDMQWVERELARATREGVSPAIESASHLLRAGGKRVRPLALLLSATCFGSVDAAVRELAVAAELVHLATLLHDDVVDDGQERRGEPTSRRIWGNAVSVLAGDLLLTHALERTNLAAPGETLAEMFATLRRLVDGEVIQLRGRTKLDAREATYFRIVEDKTASLFVWATRAGARAAGASAADVAAMGDFGSHLGVAFQLVDDVLDYAGDAAATGKALFADLHEGKLTLPLIRTLDARPDLLRAVEAVRAGDDEAGAEVVDAVRRSGACDSVRDLAHRETSAAVAALDAVPASRARQILARIASDLADRLQ